MATETVNKGIIPYDALTFLRSIYIGHKWRNLTTDLRAFDTNVEKKETKSIHFRKTPEVIAFFNAIMTEDDIHGFRVYLGAYPDEIVKFPVGTATIDLPHKIEFVSQITVGFVATTLSGDEYRDVHQKMLLPPPPLNHGTLCPPDDCPK
jgi:hypothetical protein